jgi:hypothetical protein
MSTHTYSEDQLVEQSAIQYFHLYDGKSSMFSHQKFLHSIYAIN